MGSVGGSRAMQVVSASAPDHNRPNFIQVQNVGGAKATVGGATLNAASYTTNPNSVAAAQRSVPSAVRHISE